MDAWMNAMRRGDFAAAWRVSDAVLREQRPPRLDRPRHLQLLWDGRELHGSRVLVHCYHGLGDTLQFVQLLPLLRARTREVILWAQPALLGLLRGAAGIDRLEALHDGAPNIARDADIELMELPHILRLTPARIPRRVPYLHVPASRELDRHEPAAAWPRPARIGLVWRAGDWDPARSIPITALAPLAGLPGITWYGLQYPPTPTPFRLRDLACADLLEQARRLRALDLVISVDTMIAHLAGALGVPVWTLLPSACDWRWMDAREDSPWYPRMRLLRQRGSGDWNEVIERVAAALRRWCAARAESPSWRNVA